MLLILANSAKTSVLYYSMKKLFSFFVAAVVTMICLSVSVCAFEEEPIVPIEPEAPYSYTREIHSYLSLPNTTATCISTVFGIPSQVTKIDIDQYLQKKVGNNWITIASWNKVYTTTTASFINTKTGLGSGTYRVYTLAYVFNNSSVEVVSAVSTQRTILECIMREGCLIPMK